MNRQRGAVAFLALLIAASYGLSVTNGFVFDDLIFVTRDPRVQSIAETPRLFVEPLWGFSDAPGNTHVHQYYRPLQTAPLALNLALVGNRAWPSHVLNLLLHFLNTLVFLSILSRMGISRHAALGATALFAVHPGWSEAVLWISDVAGLGATFAILAILRLHMDAGSGGRHRAPAIGLLFLLGMWFKEVAVIAPAILLLHDLVLSDNRGKQALWSAKAHYLALLPAAALYLALRVHALGGLVPGLEQTSLSPGSLIVNGIGLIPEFVRTLLWPFSLSMYHDFTPIRGAADPRLWAGLVLSTAVVLGFALSVTKRYSRAAFAYAWLIVTTLPYLLVRWPKLNVYAERYTYLPAMGVLMLAALAVARIPTSRPATVRACRAAFALVLVLFVAVNVARTREWHDEISIYTSTLSGNGRAELVRNNLALRYLELGRYEQGVVEIEKLLAIDPDFAEAHHNLGLLSLATDDLPRALAAFRRAKELSPTKPETLLNLGYVYDRLGRREEAVASYWRLTDLDPRHTAAWYNLAVVASDAGQLANAQYAVDRVLMVTPDDQQAINLRNSLLQNPAASIQRASKTTDRTRAAATARLCDKARKRMQAGDYRRAEGTLHAAAWLDERSALPHHYLANLYFLTGRLTRALEETREALARAPNNTLYRRNMQELEITLSDREKVEKNK